MPVQDTVALQELIPKSFSHPCWTDGQPSEATIYQNREEQGASQQTDTQRVEEGEARMGSLGEIVWATREHDRKANMPWEN